MDADAKRVLDRMAQVAGEVSEPAHLRGDSEWVAQYRDQILQMRPLAGPPEPVFEQTQFHFEGPDGPLDLRVYRPGPGMLPARNCAVETLTATVIGGNPMPRH